MIMILITSSHGAYVAILAGALLIMAAIRFRRQRSLVARARHDGASLQRYWQNQSSPVSDRWGEFRAPDDVRNVYVDGARVTIREVKTDRNCLLLVTRAKDLSRLSSDE